MKKKILLATTLALTLGTSLMTYAAQNDSTGKTIVNANILPTISLSVSTNTINFDNVTPLVESYDKNMVVSVQSNNTYTLSTQATGDFKTNDSQLMSIDHLEYSVDNGNSQAFETKSIEIAKDEPSTEKKDYNINLKLKSDWNIKPGKYSTTIIYKAQQ